ncbi:MAG: hypothetical protein OIF55_19825 [Amphritea sp.]|nr:hypothetical protein [Amphritea sp.]
MKIMNGDRQKVARWIDYQFEHNDTFPSKCIRTDQKGVTTTAISPQHLQAYREWSKTPATDTALSGWVDQWLNEQDQRSLIEGLRRKSF